MVKLRHVGGVGISQAKWRAVWSGGWGSVIGRGRAHSKAWRVKEPGAWGTESSSLQGE